jgi:hypothetical protein
MSRVDILRLAFIARQGEHGARDFILILRRKAPNSVKGFLQKLGHGAAIHFSCAAMKRYPRARLLIPGALAGVRAAILRYLEDPERMAPDFHKATI